MIIDDYRISFHWEKIISNINIPVIAIDDMNRSHLCDILIDSRWEGINNQNRYDRKIPQKAISLIGPRYLLIDEIYTQKSNYFKNKDSIFQITLSIGGGGDLKILLEILKYLIDSKPFNLEFVLKPIIGTFSKNKNALIELSKNHNQILPIQNNDGLYDELRKTDLFIGATGGTFFEALALKIPSLTFSIHENQQNQHSNFEDFGHYFHLNEINKDVYKEMSTLIWLMVNNINRINDLYCQPSMIEIDGKGVNRITKYIDKIIKKEPISKIRNYQNNKKYLNPERELKKIDDRSINRYLEAHNLDDNLKQMTNQNAISHISHYIWWLRDCKRESYELKRDGRSMLFIWHQLTTVNFEEYIISGWFISSKLCNLRDIIYAMQKQIEMIDRYYQKIKWVAVAHRENSFVRQMNIRFGFIEIESTNPIYKIIQSCFPNASRKEFIYYMRHNIEFN